jgi:hypothetical protein
LQSLENQQAQPFFMEVLILMAWSCGQWRMDSYLRIKWSLYIGDIGSSFVMDGHLVYGLAFETFDFIVKPLLWYV